MSWDLSNTATDLLNRLGLNSWTDASGFVTQAEVFGYFDEAAQRLAELGLFVALNEQQIAANSAAYPMASTWLDSMHVAIDGQQLRPSSTAELLAMDSTWPTTVCASGSPPIRYSMDAAQLGVITLYPIPAGSGELESIDHVTPASITITQTTAPIPTVLSDYFLYFALQRCRGKESQYAMPEVAAAAQAQCQLYEQIVKAYWGGLE